MRLPLIIAGALLCPTAASAVEVPIAGLYGTPAGCAAETGAAASSDGEKTVFRSDRVRFSGAICPFTAVKDATSPEGAAGWEVKIRCASGHDEEVPGTLFISEEPNSKLTVALTSGLGPEGEFPACTAP